MSISQLKDTSDVAGQKVQDPGNGRARFAINLGKGKNSHSVDGIKKLNASLGSAKMAQELVKSAYEDARASLNAEPVNKKSLPVKDGKPDVQAMKNQFVKDFKNLVTSGTTGTGNAGLTIPEDIQLRTRTLIRSFTSLESLVNVRNVTISHGSRVYEKLTDVAPLKDLDDGPALIGDDDGPELTIVKYLIHRYAGITTVTNTLLKDTVDNIIQWSVNWATKKDVVTRNAKILEVMGKVPKKPTISKSGNIEDLENNTLDPTIEDTFSFTTNQSGYNILSRLKDASGRYLIQLNVTSPDKYVIDGKPVVRMIDKWLPDISGLHPLYFGDLKQGIILFGRQQIQADTTNTDAGSFEHDTAKFHFIDRFDIRSTDDGAFAAASSKIVVD